MSIELTFDQSQAVASTSEPVVVVDPRTNQTYRLVREELFKQLESVLHDASTWTAEEMGILAGQAFGELDDTDYSEYLQEES